jgi:tRNA threonylcarbamoyl adenosine modification protein YjeE
MSTKLIVTNYKNFKCGVKLNEGELVNIRFQPNEDVQIGDIYKVKITEVTSPTFNLLNQYDVNKFVVNHYDLFRLKNDGELKSLGLFEDNLNTITLIEWPEIIKKKPEKLIELFFKYEDDYQKRSVQIKGLKL